VVYGVENIAVGSDAFVVVEVSEGFLEEDNKTRLGLGGCFSISYEHICSLTPCSLRSQPRGVVNVLQ